MQISPDNADKPQIQTGSAHHRRPRPFRSGYRTQGPCGLRRLWYVCGHKSHTRENITSHLAVTEVPGGLCGGPFLARLTTDGVITGLKLLAASEWHVVAGNVWQLATTSPVR